MVSEVLEFIMVAGSRQHLVLATTGPTGSCPHGSLPRPQALDPEVPSNLS